MKNLLFLFFIILVTLNIQAQNIYDSIYKFKKDIYKHCATDSNFYYKGGIASSDLSLIGLYLEGLKLYDKARYQEIFPINDSIVDKVRDVKAIDPRKYIIDRAKMTSIVIFNEAHYNPRNRIFVTSLLDSLRKIGYSVFAAEAFANDSTFNQKILPLTNAFYTNEPQFGNMIRRAKKLGYYLLPYEEIQPIVGQNREQQQAKNIDNYLSKHPNSKIIIYCGYDHIAESPIGKNKLHMMAYELKNITHIDPLTIDQVYFRERINVKLERPDRQLLKADDYQFFLDSKGKMITPYYTDASLYIPTTQIKYNRPAWIFENGMKPLKILPDSINISYPIMIKVILKSESINDAIPIDVIEVESKSALEKTSLSVFPHSTYKIIISNPQQQKQVLSITSD